MNEPLSWSSYFATNAKSRAPVAWFLSIGILFAISALTGVVAYGITFVNISTSPHHNTSLRMVASALSLLAFEASGTQPVKNGGFESANPADYWLIDPSEAKQAFSISADKTDVKEGTQSLLISADQPARVTLRQQVFLPVGTLWRLTGWVKSSASSVSADAKPSDDGPDAGPVFGIETQVGNQGFTSPIQSSGQWQHQDFLFRVPSPGRMTVALRALNNQSGKIWLDDIRLERVPETLQEESATISGVRLTTHPIDLKQGGQFIEPLCDVIPSLLAQQVRSTSFEEETPWNQAYKKEVDQPHRPWYPDGSVHAATYSYDTTSPYNGKRSQRIELPLANTWAGISQDGFYLDAGHSYRLKLHMRGEGNVAVRAFLHGDGAMIAGPVSLGRAPADWAGADVLLNANRTERNATLTVEFEGPGTFWVDRVYLIDRAAVLGLWRPDVVSALSAMKPGIVRFGGSAIETHEWEDTVGNWDKRDPFPDDPWGGLQENFVGPEEFIQLVKFIGAEPLVCLRWTGKTPQDAANEVEYFNGAANTKWGQKRAHNGHAEPYHVKFWEVGNEVGGPEYDATLAAFAEAMRKVDPAIKVLTSYPSANTVRLAGNEIDYLTPHHYSIGDLNGTEEDFKQLQKEIERDGQGKDIRVSVTEWNATGGEFGLTRGMLQTMGNALACSRYQNMLHRYADLVEIANLSNMSTSFGGGQFQTGPGWIYKIPSYYTQGLYQRAAGSFPLKIDRSSALSFYLHEPDLDATLSPDGKTLRIYAVNSTGEIRKVKFHLLESLGSVETGEASVVSDRITAPDSEAMNSRDDPNRIGVRTQKVGLSGSEFKFEFAPFSVTLLELQLHGKP
jgi:alpha-L-arabinofuranosidase